ncbi:hypothetical protein SPRG_22084 [Saprolegnia parasitica CBS 223.65]|uniref:Uncharacterized protein n=1 Tax=Saprolegnia parasitica (strain CBS 223.65) TaxID=695850 RepID=A0A067CYK1_SAPPC|nr:hypothetical protein SPRG_22084 [Saprolegnia parasitica CBS 223.65]KDO34335.1 hypothetical protein SPRG_22084 [Saprolegnia parasitica CBS 223.65]|eukprot:XP_012195348.1 hypothetical protein SPRG_22084 [Saprolegnia parasitica CBS 223.65]
MHAKARAASLLSETDHDDSDAETLSTMSDPVDATKSLAQLLSEGRKDLVRKRLQLATIDAKELTTRFEGKTVLNRAVADGHDDVVKLVLARPEMDATAAALMGPVFVAIGHHRLDMVQLLVAACPALLTASANMKGEFDGDSIAHYAVHKRATAVLTWLLAQNPSFVHARNKKDETPLHAAGRKCNVNAIAMLLRTGADANAVDTGGNSVVHTFVMHRDLALDEHDADLDRLLRLCCNVSLDIKNKYGKVAADLAPTPNLRARLDQESAFRLQFPLHCMARANDVSGIQKWLLEISTTAENTRQAVEAALSVQDMDGKTVLMHAVEALDSNAPIQVADVLSPHCTKQILALQDKRGRTVVEVLLEKDLVCKENVDGITNTATLQVLKHLDKQLPLDYTAIPLCRARGRPRGHAPWDELQQRLEASRDIATINEADAHGNTALHYACYFGNDRILALLLQQSKIEIGIETCSADEWTPLQLIRRPLHVATSNNHAACVRLLLQAGAHHGFQTDISAADVQVHRSEASENGRLCEVVLCDNWLLEQTYPAFYLVRLLDVDEALQCIQAKKTPLHVAIAKGLSTSILEALFSQFRSNVDAQSTDGTSALMIAAKVGSLAHVQYLLQQEADVDLVATNDCTALLHAAIHGHLAIVELLLVHRADLDPNCDKHCQILELLEKEERARDNSQEFRNKRALSMITMTTDDVFKDDSFLRAIRCNASLGPTFLDDCVDLRRHEAVFSKLDLIYGKSTKDSPLRAVLTLDLQDPNETFATQQACLEHPAFRRVLEIKWMLFGRRLYLQQLLMNLLLLVAMTTSSLLSNDITPQPIVYTIGLSTLIFVAVGLVVVQCLRPRVLAAYARFSDTKALFHGCLVLLTVIGTVLLVVPVLYSSDALRITDWFTPINNVVLALSTLYFIHIELQEMRVNMSDYLASTMNRVQLINYAVILCLFVPIQVGWIRVSDDIQVGLGATLTLGLWVLSLQFLEVVSSASYLLPMMSDLLSDIWNFFILFGVFQLGLTLTFYQLFRGHGDDAFGSLGQSFMTTYFVAFGQVPLDSLSVFSPSLEDNMSSSPTAMYTGVALLMMLHSAIVVVVLLNVLLALMNQTVTGGLEKAKTRALMSYAQCILRLEGAMHLNQAETIALTHVKDTCGKRTLHPIFRRVFLAPTSASRAAWLDQMQTLDKVVMDQVGFVVDGLDHVSHFTDLNVREVFAREFDVLATAQQQLLGAIEVARRSRGQFKKEILAKLEKRTSKDLRELQSQLLDVWNRKGTKEPMSDDMRCLVLHHVDKLAHSVASKAKLLLLVGTSGEAEPMSDHDKCAMLYQVNQRSTLEAVLAMSIDKISTTMSRVCLADADATRVEQENEALRLELVALREAMADDAAATSQRMESMTQQMESMAKQLETVLLLLSRSQSPRRQPVSPTAMLRRLTRL